MLFKLLQKIQLLVLCFWIEGYCITRKREWAKKDGNEPRIRWPFYVFKTGARKRKTFSLRPCCLLVVNFY